jgi:TPR repeat protein
VLAEFEIERDAGLVVVPVTIQGKDYPFLVDMASPHSAFDVSLRLLLGKAVEEDKVPHGDKAAFPFAMPPDARVGGLPFPPDVPVEVGNLMTVRRIRGRDVFGTLGMDFLSRYVVRLDFDRGRLTLSRLPGRDPGQPVPLKIEQGPAVVEADVRGFGPPASFLVHILVTGIEGCLDEETYHQLDLIGKLRPSGAANFFSLGPEHLYHDTKKGSVGRLKLGPFEHEGLSFSTAPGPCSLALPFWMRYTSTFDFPAGVLYLRPSSRHGAGCRQGPGVLLARVKGRTIVFRVREDGPEASAGIQPGDELISVDGRSAEATSIPALNHLLLGQEGRAVPVVLRRRGKIHQGWVRRDQDSRVKPPGRSAAEAEDLYQEGIKQLTCSVNEDACLAFLSFAEAARSGHPVAQAMVGWMTYFGTGTERNETEGRRLLDVSRAALWQAAQKGDPTAQALIGGMYRMGLCLEENYREAALWYRKSADKGFAWGQSGLAILYRCGKGVEKDEQEAARWMRKAADGGFVFAMYCLGVLYQDGQGAVKDAQQVCYWYRRGAEKGSADCMYRLGCLYAEGLGVKRDPSQAAVWFLRAIGEEHVAAMTALGRLYLHGQGVERDCLEAFHWFRQAADREDEDAMYHLGQLYERGEGVKKDENEALNWYGKAAEHGHAEAKKRLQKLTRQKS